MVVGKSPVISPLGSMTSGVRLEPCPFESSVIGWMPTLLVAADDAVLKARTQRDFAVDAAPKGDSDGFEEAGLGFAAR